MKWCQLTLLRDQKIIAQYKIRKAAGTFERMRGLLFSEKLNENEGMLISPCNSVHTCMMSYPIDIMYIDKSFRVCRLVSGLKPWRASMALAASFVVELHAGQIERNGIQIGDEIQCQDY